MSLSHEDDDVTVSKRVIEEDHDIVLDVLILHQKYKVLYGESRIYDSAKTRLYFILHYMVCPMNAINMMVSM